LAQIPPQGLGTRGAKVQVPTGTLQGAMSFLKGNRESPGMIVQTGENPRSGKLMGALEGRSEAKDLIFGEVEKASASPYRGSRPPLQPAASAHVDARTGPPSTLLMSRVGPGRARRQPHGSELENLRQFKEQAAQGFRDAQATRQQVRDTQGKNGVTFGIIGEPDEHHRTDSGGSAAHAQSLSRRSSRERIDGPQVDPEMAEILRGIEQTAEVERCDGSMMAESYLDAQAVAEKVRSRNRGQGIFGDEPVEEVTIRRAQAPVSCGPRDHMAVEAAEEARAQRAQTLVRNRGAAGGIFACDPPRAAPPTRDNSNNIISW